MLTFGSLISIFSSVSAVLVVLCCCSCVTVTANVTLLDLVGDCCHGRCGNVYQALEINSDGFDKTGNQTSALIITSGSDFSIEHATDTCTIQVRALDYVTVNISFCLKQGISKRSVLILDSNSVEPKETVESENGQKLFSETGPIEQHRTRQERQATMNCIRKYQVINYRISPSRIFTIAVRYQSLKNEYVTDFAASFVAEQGNAGKIFFITLGAVVLFFVFGVPGSFMLYRRYAKRKKLRRMVVSFDASTMRTQQIDGPLHASEARREIGAQRELSDFPGRSSSSSSPHPTEVRPRRVSFGERVRKATGLKVDPICEEQATSLPKHDLLEKQERRREMPRPVSIMPPLKPKTEWAFPGVEPGREKTDHPISIQRPLQSSSSRVISHPTINEEDLNEDLIPIETITLPQSV